MEANVKNNKGFSLVEMLIAVVIMAFSLLALSEVMVSSISINLGNEMRNTAVRLTTQTAEVLLTLPVDTLSTCGLSADPDAPAYNASYTYNDINTCLGTGTDYQKYPNPVQSIKGFQQNFNITWVVSALSSNLREITITVAFKHRGANHTNSAVVYKHRTL
jgi:prepilin-type N-terminal cleavage/methylation domain-containing protein